MAVFAIFDSALDVYVTLTISIILTGHIKKINSTGARENINLYISVVLTNAIRTAALSVVNMTATVYVLLVSKPFLYVAYDFFVFNKSFFYY